MQWYLLLILIIGCFNILIYLITNNFEEGELVKYFYSERYVSLCEDTFNGRRTGNLMFTLAALLYVANRTNRIPSLPQNMKHDWIDKLFNSSLIRLDNSYLYNSDIYVILQERNGPLAYDPIFENPHSNKTIRNSLVLIICGYFQNLRYINPIENLVRKHLEFKNETTAKVKTFVEKHQYEICSNFSSFNDVLKIGIHIRRGDFLQLQNKGFAVVDEKYMQESIDYHLRHSSMNKYLVIFTSDDIIWAYNAFAKIAPKLSKNVSVVFSRQHSGIFDMCLVSSCDKLIISTGSFSWWAGWLSNKTTIYYSLYPGANKSLAKGFLKENYYKQEWIGLPPLN